MFKKPAIKKTPLLIALPFAWFGIVALTLIILVMILLYGTSQPTGTQRYSLYSAKPLVLGEMTVDTGIGDPRAAKIEEVFLQYNCPITGMGDVFVNEADKNNIPYWVVPAIAFQESSCGKNIPIADGRYSYNAWGWAVYGDNVKEFDGWEHGIKVVSEYMNERFFSQGITDLCEIMKTYTPPSEGSWCEGVDYFKDIIHEYQTPLENL